MMALEEIQSTRECCCLALEDVCLVDCVDALSCQNSRGARVGPVWRPSVLILEWWLFDFASHRRSNPLFALFVRLP